MSKYIKPEFQLSNFNCPHCDAYSQQNWRNIQEYAYRDENDILKHRIDFHTAYCILCHNISIWEKQKMIYPISSGIEHPNDELPDDIKSDYLEARNIIQFSPRGASALLRLALQKLCIHLGEKGTNLNQDIRNLVEKKSLSPTIEQALHNIRVIGNNAVHPGTIDLKDNTEIASALFGFINVIAENLITIPMQIEKFTKSHISKS